MSGRGFSRGGRGRSGPRGGGRGRGRSNRPNTGNKSANEIRFHPINGGRRIGHTYETVKEHVIREIQGSSKFEYAQDVVVTLRDLSKIDMNLKAPTRQRA